ncbi:rhodanese-related sulfurtransferase [Anoxybacillus vitaminiphilus]|uniref:Rhodanese-related sulfurtransferase n=1 Tax=Paranoxybacillus vitaminiphilus TaxID=581036 RepID=A0A327YHZ3_9BACL|nr:sulfurtransferase TusA family protein [Anoxybacillus vitaminiphilus]RAK19385.1 rhodanese-related sulfurtransferase [Anoxybacillus vitaminiphilus]
MQITVNKVLDAKGLSCPMPIVKTKKAMEELDPGQVLEVQATDKGSLADIQGWAKNTGHQYIGTIEEGDVLKHYLRKADVSEAEEEKKHPYVIDLKELERKLENGEKFVILDVREQAEYAFGHIPGAINIPLGELEARFTELNKDDEIYVICRTGNRSDLAAQQLAEKGFTNVINVVPGMVEWTGEVDKF